MKLWAVFIKMALDVFDDLTLRLIDAKMPFAENVSIEGNKFFH